MKISKNSFESREHIVVEQKGQRFLIDWFAADLYWIMLDYAPKSSFIVTKNTPLFWEFFTNLFATHHFKNNTLIWLSEARLEEESSILKITKGKDYFRIKFIQGDHDYLAKARNICPICFCLSGSNHQEIANAFSNFLHKLLSRDYN